VRVCVCACVCVRVCGCAYVYSADGKEIGSMYKSRGETKYLDARSKEDSSV